MEKIDYFAIISLYVSTGRLAIDQYDADPAMAHSVISLGSKYSSQSRCYTCHIPPNAMGFLHPYHPWNVCLDNHSQDARLGKMPRLPAEVVHFGDPAFRVAKDPTDLSDESYSYEPFRTRLDRAVVTHSHRLGYCEWKHFPEMGVRRQELCLHSSQSPLGGVVWVSLKILEGLCHPLTSQV